MRLRLPNKVPDASRGGIGLSNGSESERPSAFCFEVNEGELLHGETVGSLEKPKRRMGEDFLWHGNG
jgi:hypothetical protein